ncbi:nitrogen regulation protein [Rhodopirellula sp. JC740]|uniref:Nitrogen regulation protein n=2 Tax=Rhodopirellula halodulae TaxID=2894198 RepID=A0ABS8NE09_9BACT|nr:nitrogen regulation protein [Rhodopirellula sp. JC740]
MPSTLLKIKMAERQLKIFLLHGDEYVRRIVRANLELLSHHVELSTDSPAVMQRRCQENPPDVAIIGDKIQSSSVFDVLNSLSRENLCPIVALLQHSDFDRAHRLMEDNVMGVLVEPVNDSDLRTSIYLARRRFEQARRMKRQIDDLEQQLVASQHNTMENGS